MRYAHTGPMVQAHIADMAESGFNDGECISAAMSTVLTIMFCVFENDEERVIEELERLTRAAVHGIDSGHLKDYHSIVVN